MSLPLPWVDRIFEKLTLVYGQAFLARWRDIDLNAVKSDWCHELAAMESSPHRIAFALANLPDRPPTVIEFRHICRSAPAPEGPRLPEPKADPERLKAELAKLAPMLNAATSSRPSSDGCDWARRIVNGVADTDVRRTPTVMRMAREALVFCHDPLANHAVFGHSFANQ